MKKCEIHTKVKAVTLMMHDLGDINHYYCEYCTTIILSKESPLRLVWLKDMGIKK
jgi:hypothetical protein